MAEANRKDNRKPYILTRKSHSGIDAEGNRREYKPGETVLLTEGQFKSFRDRFTTPAVFKSRQAAIQAAVEDAGDEQEPAPEKKPAPASTPNQAPEKK